MNNLFASFYEIVNSIWLQDYDYIFRYLYDSAAYASMGWFLILLPIGLLSMFYFLWRYPYGHVWHWLIWILVIGLVTGGVTYGFCHTRLAEYLATPETEEYASSLVFRYALSNTIYATVLGALHSLWMSRFSKIQMHLPF